VGINAWNLLQVRSALGLLPYNRSYMHLFLPSAATMGVTLLLRKNSVVFGHDWIAVLASAVVAYTVFGAIAVMLGLDADDRLIVKAIWLRVRGFFGPGTSEAQA
jgi:hypothetical protein